MNYFVKLNTSVGEYKANESYEIDSVTADKWVAAGLAEKVEHNPTDEAIAKFAKSLEDRDQRLVERIASSLKTSEAKIPAVAKEDNGSFSEFVVAVGRTVSKNHSVREKAFDLLANKYGQKTTTTMTAASGGVEAGYLVPEIWGQELLAIPPYAGAAFPDRVRKVPMQSDVLYFPVLDQTSSPSNGASAFCGGMSIGVVATEGSAPTNSTQPSFLQLALNAKRLLAFTEVSNTLLDNSPLAVASIVNEGFRNAYVAWIDYQIFNGAGSSTTLFGVIDHGATIAVNRNTSSDVKLEDLAAMWARLPGSSRKSAAWFMNPTAMAKLPLLGNSNHLVMLTNGAQGEFVLSFLGLPIIPCEALPTIGNAGDVVLADMRHYIVGVNKDIVVSASDAVGFTRDVVTYRVVARVDGKPQLTAPITLADGSSTVSPFIQLDVAASS